MIGEGFALAMAGPSSSSLSGLLSPPGGPTSGPGGGGPGSLTGSLSPLGEPAGSPGGGGMGSGGSGSLAWPLSSSGGPAGSPGGGGPGAGGTVRRKLLPSGSHLSVVLRSGWDPWRRTGT